MNLSSSVRSVWIDAPREFNYSSGRNSLLDLLTGGQFPSGYFGHIAYYIANVSL